MSLLVEQTLAPKVAQGGRRAAIVAVATLSAVTGVGSAPAGSAEVCAAPTAAMQQLEMYFGSSVKGASVVTEAWSQFLASEVTLRFVDGLTVFDANGQFHRLRRILREPGQYPSRMHSGEVASQRLKDWWRIHTR